MTELFDITGLITPIVATMKIDLHDLVKRKLDWDDILPDELRQLWVSYFELMSEIRNIKYKRAVVPADTESLNIQTLDFGDASQALVCAAIYVRFKKKSRVYSCQLIVARSRIVPDGLSQPRDELYAALVNTHTKTVLWRKSQVIIEVYTDSQITLYWICNTNLPLKQWVRNHVTEIHRFTKQSQWKHVKSEDIIADFGTRRCSRIENIQQVSIWVNSFKWTHNDESEFPELSTTAEISLNSQDVQTINKESKEVISNETR